MMFDLCEVLARRAERIEDIRARRDIVAAIKDPHPDLEAEMLTWMRDDPEAPA